MYTPTTETESLRESFEGRLTCLISVSQSLQERDELVLLLTGQLEPVVTLILTEERILGERAKIEFQQICDALDCVVSRPVAAHFSLSVNRPDLAVYFCVSPSSESAPMSSLRRIKRFFPRRVDCD